MDFGEVLGSVHDSHVFKTSQWYAHFAYGPEEFLLNPRIPCEKLKVLLKQVTRFHLLRA